MQVRWVDQTQYPMIVVASLSAVPQSCRTPLPNQYLDCMLLAVYTHTLTLTFLCFTGHTKAVAFHLQPCHGKPVEGCAAEPGNGYEPANGYKLEKGWWHEPVEGCPAHGNVFPGACGRPSQLSLVECEVP